MVVVFFLEINVYIHEDVSGVTFVIWMFTFNEDVSGVTFVICGVTSCQWCYLMKLCKLFHKEDKWLNWNKLYYSWIKLTLITMYKSSFLHIKWNKIQLWKLVCFIMQLKWYSTTTYPNIVEKKLMLQRKYPKLLYFTIETKQEKIKIF